MACDCELYECLPVAPNILQCGDDIATTLLADESGIWTMAYEFNNSWFAQSISVTNNEIIELPNVFNENYNHTIKLYKTDGSLFDDTCFVLDSGSLLMSRTVTSPSSSGGAGNYITVEVEADGSTFEVPAGLTVWLIFPGNQGYVRNVDFTQSGTTITMTNGAYFTAGQQLLLMYL